jgi:hypothetical protein
MSVATPIPAREIIIRRLTDLRTELDSLESSPKSGLDGRVRHLQGQIRALARLLWTQYDTVSRET